MNRFERYPRLTIFLIWLVLLVATIGGVEWGLTLMQNRLNLTKADQPGEPRVLRLREWPPGMVKVIAATKNRANDPIGPVDREYELRIDQAGFIWPSLVHDQPDFEIVFLGGSTTECLYVRPAARFPHLVGRLLEDRTALKINSINAGRSGNNTMHAVLNYLGKVAPRRPRFVVLMEATNDIGVLNKNITYWNEAKNISLVEDDRKLRGRRPILDFLTRLRERTIPFTSRVVSNGLNIIEEGVAGAFVQRAPSPAPAAKSAASAADRDEAEVRRRELLRNSFEPALRSFVRLAKVWGSEPVLMTQVRVDETDGGAGDFLSPEALRQGNFDRASFGSLHDYAAAIVRHVAVTEDAILIDLAVARRWTREDVYDGLHFTETGSRHVAEIVARALTPLIVQSGNAKQVKQ